MQFGDKATFTYQGISDEGRERWLASTAAVARKGEALNIPIDEKKDGPTLVAAKLAQINAEVSRRMEEAERSLRAMDARLILADHVFVKDEPASINFRLFQARDRSKVKEKFATACKSGKLICVDDGLSALERVPSELDPLAAANQRIARLEALLEKGGLLEGDDSPAAAGADSRPPVKEASRNTPDPAPAPPDVNLPANESDDYGDLLALARPALNELAERMGVPEPDKLPNKKAVAEAIRSADSDDAADEG